MKERDEMISELKMADLQRSVERVSDSVDERALELQQQRVSLDQHYKQIISKLSSHNEVSDIVSGCCTIVSRCSSFGTCLTICSFTDLLAFRTCFK